MERVPWALSIVVDAPAGQSMARIMKIKQSSKGGAGWPLGLCILAVGIALGALLDPLGRVQGLGTSAPVSAPLSAIGAPPELAAFLEPAPAPAAAQDNGLETLSVEFDREAASVLQRVQREALNRGMIIQEEADTVEGEVGLGGKSVSAELRIKGDWTDHVDTDKWSLRIKLKGDKLGGMSVFSIQHPKTRGMLWEWFVLAAARRESILAPRSSFVNVVLNGNPMGIYYLEEHFSKELLESQERREGPIVLFDESTRWSSLLQANNVTTKNIKLRVPFGSSRVRQVSPASIRGYGEKRLSSIESLSRSMYSAVEQMKALQSMSIAKQQGELPTRRMRAIEDLRGQTLEQLIDMDKMAKLHALSGLYQVWHAMVWHNLRFYHDPVLDRLEPIMFDCNAHMRAPRDLPMFRVNDSVSKLFASSKSFYHGVFRHLRHFTAPGYIEDLMAELGDQLRVYEAALDAEFGLSDTNTVDGMLQRLRAQQVFLRTVIYPVDAINFHAAHDLRPREAGGPVEGNFYVDCWGTTRTPVEVRGFEFSNGVLTPASAAIGSQAADLSLTREGGVILPNDGSPVRLTFSSDSRLAGLANVKQVLDLARDQDQSSAALELDVKIVYRPLAAETLQREPLIFRQTDPAWALEGGRPSPPSLQEALAAHSFLEYRPETHELWVKQGEWHVKGDLVVPRDFALHATEALLHFEPEAALISSSPLLFNNVQLGPIIGNDRWSGIIVMQSSGRSHWNQVTVHATDALARGGWVVTGGITFYRSPVSMVDCHINGTLAEDGTNIFSTDFSMERVRFTDCVSDSFDGDFVTGSLKSCSFQDGLADGVDFSGSQVLVENCEFIDMGDKGISAGENSQVRVLGGRCQNVSIGIAAKDRSHVEVEGMRIDGARHYALTAFIKKPEFGAASMTAKGVQVLNSGLGDALVQSSCTLEWDGTAWPTEDLDVKQLYRDKILGQ